MTFDGANKYCEESIEKLQQLATYIKERKRIEEDYAQSLRTQTCKLCKSVSLKPFKKDDWFEESDKTNVYKTTLWRTFYEIIDDTAQISKSHDAFADSLKSKILEPLSTAIKQQKEERKKLQETAQDFVRRINEAKLDVKKTYQKYEEAFEKHIEYQSTAERYNATGRIKDYDKVLTKVRASKQKLDDATDRHEDAKALLERVKSDIDRYESPKTMERVREIESNRMRGALTLVLELIDLERRKASMDEVYVAGMAEKLKQIDLAADDAHFYRVHIQDSLNLQHQSSKSGPLMKLGPLSPMGLALTQSCTSSPCKEKAGSDDSEAVYNAPPPRYTYEYDGDADVSEDQQPVYPVLERAPSSPPAYCGSMSSAHLMSSSFDQLSAPALSTGNMRAAIYE